MGQSTERIDNPFGPRAGRGVVSADRRGEALSSAQALRPAVSEEPPAPATERPARDLTLRRLNGWDEEFLARNLASPNTARLCNVVLARCLVAPEASIDDALVQVRGLLVAERDRALAQLRVASLGEVVEAEVACPACSEKLELSFPLASLGLDFSVPVGPLRVALSDGRRAMARLPTAGDQEHLLDRAPDSEAERRSLLLGRVVLAVGEDAPQDAGIGTDAARALSIRDRRAIQEAVDAALPDFDFRMSLTCASCGQDFSAPFDIRAFFLMS